MMIPNAPDIPKSPPRIEHDGKFYSMLLSKESSLANHSFRVASGSVPFVWESVPGTPKVAVAAAAVPTITPPPSYWYHAGTAANLKSTASENQNENKNKEKHRKKHRNFIAAIFRKLTLIRRKRTQPPSSRISSSSSPSPSSSRSSISSSRFSSSRVLFSSAVRDDQPDDLPRCFLCFRVPSIPKVLFFRRGRKGKIGADHSGEI